MREQAPLQNGFRESADPWRSGIEFGRGSRRVSEDQLKIKLEIRLKPKKVEIVAAGDFRRRERGAERFAAEQLTLVRRFFRLR